MLRTASSLPPKGLSTLGSGPARFQTTPPACYRASWQLPGPDFHRQATTSLRTRRHTMAYVTASPPVLLGARKTLTALSLAGCQGGTAPTGPAGGPSVLSGSAPPTPAINPDIHKIKHVVVIMQENRSFDSYFGTYPGADGIPMRDGVPTVCQPDPHTSRACGRSTTVPT
jgi:hypothetical protein